MATAAPELMRKQSQLSNRSIDYVGFANFPNQVFRRSIKNGFDFSIMVVGKQPFKEIRDFKKIQ